MHSKAQHSNDNDLANIPPFAHPLVPYIKPRQETLRIRQALTRYLRSQISFRTDDASHLALCMPSDATDIKNIPAEVTGLRREYLTAVQENLAARREYRSIPEKIGSRRLEGVDSEKGEIPGADPSSNLQAYLRLRRGRQRHAKLQVFQHYLEELKARDAGLNLETQMGADQLVMLPEMEGSSDDKSEDIEGLVHKLETAVVRAKSKLDREKKLLEELKTERESQNGDSSGITPSVKVHGLERIRAELVQWVEDKLTSMSGNEDTLQELPPEKLEDSTRLLEERKGEIATQYAAYIEARKTLLNAASRVCQPAEPSPTKSHFETTDYDANAEEPALYPLDALAFASENLLPLSKSQRALALQKSYQSGMLAKEKATTLRMLNRSSDESHLLPEYPLLARQPRFIKNAASARRQTSQTTGRTKDEILSMAEAWAFASEAAGENEREYVEGKVAQGEETAGDAEKMLQEVYDRLNQDLEEVLQDDQGAVEDDIWAPETPLSKSRRAERTEGLTRGPWAGLYGRVDVD